MPIEIRELVIRATISQNNNASAQNTSSGQSANASSGNEQLINTCVEKVLEILRSQNQR